MKRLAKIIGQGLALVAPLLLTAWILVAFVSWIDSLVVGAIHNIPAFEHAEFFYGFGFLVGLAATALLGILARQWLIVWVVGRLERLVRRVPLVKLIYDSIRDMMGFVGSNRKSFTRCVLVRLPGSEVFTPGFVTRETFDDIPALRHMNETIAVYITASYGFMGLLLLVPSKDVLPLAMDVGDGLRFVISGGVSASEEEVKKLATESLEEDIADATAP